MFTKKLKTKGLTEIPRNLLIEKYAKENDSSRIMEFKSFKVHIRENKKNDHEINNKPILLGLHGICDSLHTWEHWEDHLEKHFRFIRIDLPFFGLSEVADPSLLNKDFYNLFLQELLNELSIKKVNLLGHSLGAYISWNFACFNPNIVDKVVLLSPPAYPQRPPPIVHLVKIPIIKKIATSYTPRFLLPLMMRGLFYNDNHASLKMIERYYEMLMCEGNRNNYMDVFKLINNFIGEEPIKLKSLKNPLLILWGKEDLWVPSSNSIYWKRDIPHAKVKIFENMRHMPHYEDVTGTLKEFLDFFQLPFEG